MLPFLFPSSLIPLRAPGATALFCAFLLGAWGCAGRENPSRETHAYTPAEAGSSDPAPSPDPGSCFTEVDCSLFRTSPDTAALLPENMGGTEPDGEGSSVWVVDRWHLGEADREANISANAWRQYGFDLDGWSTTPAQGYHCKHTKDARDADIRVDGKGGTDNSFGKNIVDGIMAALLASPSQTFAVDTRDGQFASVFVLDKLGTASDYSSLPSWYFLARGVEPKAPGTQGDWATYEWHPISNWEENGDEKVPCAGSYMAKDTWVSGVVPLLPVNLGTTESYLQLRVHQARVTITFNKERTEGQGTLGGIVQADELAEEFRSWMTPLVCGGSPLTQSLPGATADSVLQSADILLDGTQDPEKTCDGISVGLGFRVRPSALGDSAPLYLPPRACPQ